MNTMVEAERMSMNKAYKDGNPKHLTLKVRVGDYYFEVETKTLPLKGDEMHFQSVEPLDGEHLDEGIGDEVLERMVGAVEFAAEWIEDEGFEYKGPHVGITG